MLRPQSLTGKDGWGVLIAKRKPHREEKEVVGRGGGGGGVAYLRPSRKRPVSAVAGCQGRSPYLYKKGTGLQ